MCVLVIAKNIDVSHPNSTLRISQVGLLALTSIQTGYAAASLTSGVLFTARAVVAKDIPGFAKGVCQIAWAVGINLQFAHLLAKATHASSSTVEDFVIKIAGFVPGPVYGAALGLVNNGIADLSAQLPENMRERAAPWLEWLLTAVNPGAHFLNNLTPRQMEALWDALPANSHAAQLALIKQGSPEQLAFLVPRLKALRDEVCAWTEEQTRRLENLEELELEHAADVLRELERASSLLDKLQQQPLYSIS